MTLRLRTVSRLPAGLPASFACRKSSRPFSQSPFVGALPAEVHEKVPKAMWDFHVSGGYCCGALLRERGTNPLASLVATLGRLPPATPKGAKQPSVVTVHSEHCDATSGVRWRRFFPPSSSLESRWYWNEERQLAVDSFTYLGIRDFAAFGFRLEPMTWEEFEREKGDAAAARAISGIRKPHPCGGDFVGFKHVTEAVWILGVPIPRSLALIADGISMPHTDGGGWWVEVEVEHGLLGRIVSYRGDVRVGAEGGEFDLNFDE